MDILGELPDDQEIIRPELQAILKRDKSEDDARQSALKRMEDDLFSTSMRVVSDSLHFSEVTPEMTDPPLEWVMELGLKGAQERLRVARAAWLPPKEAPVAFVIAKGAAAAMIKAKSTERAGPKHLNVAIVTIGAQKDYGPVLEVEGE